MNNKTLCASLDTGRAIQFILEESARLSNETNDHNSHDVVNSMRNEDGEESDEYETMKQSDKEEIAVKTGSTNALESLKDRIERALQLNESLDETQKLNVLQDLQMELLKFAKSKVPNYLVNMETQKKYNEIMQTLFLQLTDTSKAKNICYFMALVLSKDLATIDEKPYVSASLFFGLKMLKTGKSTMWIKCPHCAEFITLNRYESHIDQEGWCAICLQKSQNVHTCLNNLLKPFPRDRKQEISKKQKRSEMEKKNREKRQMKQSK